MIVLPHSRIPRGVDLKVAKQMIAENIECVAECVTHEPVSDVAYALIRIVEMVRS